MNRDNLMYIQGKFNYQNIQSDKPDYLLILTMLFLTIMLGTYVLAYKMVLVGGYIISAGIFIFPINYAITDITTEVYGYEKTKKLIKYAFICCLLYSLVIPFIAILPSPGGWEHQPGYSYVLGNVFRFFIANSIGILIGITINGYLIAKWKRMMNGKHFWLRSIGSSAIGELITSIIADIIAFAGTTSTMGVIKLMIGIFAIKLLYSVLLAIPNSIIVMHLKIKEGFNLQENMSVFNPFNNDNSMREAHANNI